MSFQILLVIYLLALGAELFAVATQNREMQFFFKPALMLILIFYYLVNRPKRERAGYLMLAALAFSWLGDVVLLADTIYRSLFVFGLVAFLIAHLFFIFYFVRVRKLNRVTEFPHALSFAGIGLYTAVLFNVLAPRVGGLIYPVALYALAIAIMFAASLSAFEDPRRGFGRLSVAGTFLFLISDSLLAVNRFVAPFALAPVLIMLTYGLAQLLITEGSLRNLREIKDE